MGLIASIWLMVLGIAATPTMLTTNEQYLKSVTDLFGWKPLDLQSILKKIEKIAPYMGVLSVFVGLMGAFDLMTHIQWFRYHTIFSLAYFVGCILHATLGFLLGFHLLKIVMPNQSVADAARMRFKLAQYEFTLGVVAVCVGASSVVLRIFAGPA